MEVVKDVMQEEALKKSLKEKRKKQQRKMLKKDLLGWSFIIWPLLGFVLFSGFPYLLSLVLSFTELKSFFFEEMKFIGFDNYVWLFTDPTSKLFKAFGNSLYYMLNIPINMSIGVVLAALVTRKIKGKRFFSTLVFLPQLCSLVATSVVWKYMFDYDYGVFNTLLSNIGAEKLDWLGDESTFMASILFTTTWSIGTNCLLYQAAISQVDESLYEAADIDGAGPIRQFFIVTLPMITPTIFYSLTTNLVSTFQVMGTMQIYVGKNIPFGPMDAGVTPVFYMYYMMNDNLATTGLGMASAMAWLLAIWIIVITRLNFFFSKYWVHDGE